VRAAITKYTQTIKNGEQKRYIYTPKASKKDRDEGLDSFEEIKCSMMASNDNIDKNGNFTGMLAGRETKKRNIHPTVKPTNLMQYLIRLVTPNGGIVLDPFNGSGSTGKAVMYENKEKNKGYKYIGIELTEEYLPIAKARIEYVENLKEEKIENEQIELKEAE
jgi:site-specific DNA-methyltransferase (adenine-specific)